MTWWILTIFLIQQSCALWGNSHSNNQVERVLLKDVSAITLQKGRQTTGRRSSPVAQLKCEGHLCNQWSPDTVLCSNVGWDGRDVQWKCDADMPDTLHFSKVEVYCEGYDYPEDQYILAGSCGLEFSLKGHVEQQRDTSNDEYNQGNNYDNGYQQNNRYGNTRDDRYQRTSSTYGTSQGWDWNGIIMFGVAGLIVYFLYQACTQTRGGGGGGGGGGNGGGPYGGGGPSRGGSSYSNPPPYDSVNGNGADCGGNTFGRASNMGYGRPTMMGNQGGNQGYRPGFWSGMGMGALGGYMMGGRRNAGNNGYNGYGAGVGGFGANRGYNAGLNAGRRQPPRATTRRAPARPAARVSTRSGYATTKRR